MARVVVLDASVLIGHLDDRDAQHERATELLFGLAAAGAVLAASTLTLAEVMVGPARADRLSEAARLVERLGVQEVAIGADAAERLAPLRAKIACRLPDCCVLLAADDAGAEAVATFDARLAKAATSLELEALTS